MGQVLQGLPASAHTLMTTLVATLRKYQPRLADLHSELLPGAPVGHLHYTLDVRLKSGEWVTFGTTLGPEGKVLVRHLKRQHCLA